MTLNDQIQALHQTYQDWSGIEQPLPVGQYWIWEAYLKRGHTRDELIMVIKALKKGIANRERREGCLRFSNLLQDMDHFEEELAMAKPRRTAPKFDPGKTEVLKLTQRPSAPEPAKAESAGEVLERAKWIARLKECRENL